MLKGLRADIYRNGTHDFSNGGISAKAEEVTLVGPGIPEIFPVTDAAPAVILRTRTIGGQPYVNAQPLNRPEGCQDHGPMMGGTFIYSSDSRFRELCAYPVPLHDRFETAEQYRRNST